MSVKHKDVKAELSKVIEWARIQQARVLSWPRHISYKRFWIFGFQVVARATIAVYKNRMSSMLSVVHLGSGLCGCTGAIKETWQLRKVKDEQTCTSKRDYNASLPWNCRAALVRAAQSCWWALFNFSCLSCGQGQTRDCEFAKFVSLHSRAISSKHTNTMVIRAARKSRDCGQAMQC